MKRLSSQAEPGDYLIFYCESLPDSQSLCNMLMCSKLPDIVSSLSVMINTKQMDLMKVCFARLLSKHLTKSSCSHPHC